MTDSIVDKLLLFNEGLTDAEKANFKLLLGLASGGLTTGFGRPRGKDSVAAFDAVGDTLARLQPYRDRIAHNGIAYRGRPPLMTETLLRDLQAEAAQLRPSAVRFDEHYLGRGAPVANRLAVSEGLCTFVRAHAGNVNPTGVASFLFYDEEGQGIDPHIDTDIFALNVLIMLEHRLASQPQSALVVFPPGGEPERLYLAHGEMVIFFAGSIPHGRERMRSGEAVSIVTFGFQPVSE